MRFKKLNCYPRLKKFCEAFRRLCNLRSNVFPGFHPEMALFRNLSVNPPEADKSAGSFVRRTCCTPPRSPLISLTLRKIPHF